MSLIPFDFEGAAIRVNVGDDGEPLFVAKDVCDALGYAKSRDAVSTHVDDEDAVKRGILTSGGTQDVIHVNESGLYALIFGSKLEGAKKFKRWLTSEVLPAIRRNGTYAKPDTRPALKEAAEAVHAVLMLAGVRSGLASAGALAVIERHTGVATEPARLMLPAEDKALASLNATAVGKLIGLSGIKANRLLESRGLQTKDARGDWVPTDAGKKLGGELIAFDNHGHQGLQLRWPPSITEALQ